MSDERVEMLGKQVREVYHGWVVVEKQPGFMDRIFAEYYDGDERKRVYFQSATEAIEWWDRHVGKPVRLLATPLGAYRVYTIEER